MSSKTIPEFSLFLALMLLLGIQCTRSGRPRPGLTAPAATYIRQIDGNRLTLGPNMTVILAGVENTPIVEDFLQGFAGQEVEFIPDSGRQSSRRRRSAQTTGYVVTSSGRCLNRELISQSISGISGTFDSLEVYRSLAGTGALEKIQRPPQNTWSAATLRGASFSVATYNGFGAPVMQGSGFFIHPDGIGVSNHHVFEGGSSWTIRSCESGNSYEVGRILAEDPELDYVIFEVEGVRDATSLGRASHAPEQGDEIIVYGNPTGLECTLSKGVVSALRSVSGNQEVIQIDAAISPGSSGSPVVDLRGRLIGIATAKKMECENCNFAINIQLLPGKYFYSP